jgi:hypothetical protein
MQLPCFFSWGKYGGISKLFKSTPRQHAAAYVALLGDELDLNVVFVCTISAP